MSISSPLVLVILDGWGYNMQEKHNAIFRAKTPNWDNWLKNSPHILLDASGESVGLPEGQMGNSEVGHLHIGAGREVLQDYTRINKAIESGEFDQNLLLNRSIDALIANGKSLHVMGLLSAGGVHSHEDHLFALLALCAKKNFARLVLHLFLDGRDTAPQSALTSIDRLNQQLKRSPVGKIASIAGRYYAMDRDNRWERVEPVYRLIVESSAKYQFDTAELAIDSFYNNKIYDEFIPPTRINGANPIVEGDAVFFFNFRSDRARQLSSAFLKEDFGGFNRSVRPKLSQFLTMTRYSETLPAQVVFAPQALKNTLGEVVADNGLTQLRIAETEKYAHVTFFFNGGLETVFADEDRILIPSPKIATYDLQPEMSAPELTSALIDAIKSRSFDLIICNFANADMVGHSGNFEATVQAVECIDHCLGKIWQALLQQGGQMLITADHGNAEIMFDEKTGQAQTAHTCQPVPILYLGKPGWYFNAQKGKLIDIAPTILTLMNLDIPPEMTGQTLLEKNHDLVH